MSISQERLKELLAYDPSTGFFTWREDRGNGVLPGDRAGSIQVSGHRSIDVDGKKQRAHRLAFLYMTGAMPTKLVDHIDRDRDNNAWANLRETDDSGNCRNRGMGKNNTSGIKGVFWHVTSSKWVASIGVNGKTVHIGSFEDKEKAAEAYAAAAANMHGEYASPVRDYRDLRIEQLEATLREARKWIGDGEFSDGLHRDHWTPMYATVVDLVDAALREAK